MKPTPVKNIVSEISLRKTDVFLPVFEPIINSINSILLKYQNNVHLGEITVTIERGFQPEDIFGHAPINNVIVTDNGEGFNKDNINSFETPHSHKNKELGGKGMGRFTCLAAFRSMEIESHFYQEDKWNHIKYNFDQENEFVVSKESVENKEAFETTVKLKHFFNEELREASKVDLSTFAEKLLNHCLIYYLDKKLPKITLVESGTEDKIILNDLYLELAHDREREFNLGEYSFKAYIVRTPKKGRRENHYVHYCANSREVGEGKSLSKLNNLFAFPITRDGFFHFLDVYIVSEYLNKKVSLQRNSFNIPLNNDGIFVKDGSISFYDIEKELTNILQEEFQDHLVEQQERSIAKVKEHISTQSLQYERYKDREDLLKEIPAFADEETIELHLHRFAYNEIKSVERRLQNFIESNQIDEEAINEISKDLKIKTAYDRDGLAEYMVRRKAILDFFDKLLEADTNGTYKLESDIHKLILPLGVSGDPSKIGHNLWILDERFVSYNFVASDIPITRISQVKSSKEPDIITWKEGANPFNDAATSFGNKPAGEIQSLVVFEFKRPGETAHQKKKGSYQWLLTELIEKYFDAFIYGNTKKNYLGKFVKVETGTPKFGYVIVDVIPPDLERYNLDKGLRKTPYGTLYFINPGLNLHIEVITFQQLLENARSRHKPFFDKLFVHH